VRAASVRAMITRRALVSIRVAIAIEGFLQTRRTALGRRPEQANDFEDRERRDELDDEAVNEFHAVSPVTNRGSPQATRDI
jgi:hypothetical protein